MQRQEDEVRQRMSQASDTFRKTVLEAQSVRQEYFNSQLPKILRVRPFRLDSASLLRPLLSALPLSEQLLKQCADEIDFGTQYHLSRYAYLYESMILQEGVTVTPMDPGEGKSHVLCSSNNFRSC